MKLQGLQVARGVAALLVVLYHLTGYAQDKLGYVVPGGVFRVGLAGVDFFFVLSGLIITLTHAGDLGRPGRLGPYVLRRLTRIYPLCWILTLGKLSLCLLLPGLASPAKLRPDVIVASLALFPLPAPWLTPVLAVAWTLSHEMLFYALFALGVVLGGRALTGMLALWTVAIVAVRPSPASSYLLRFLLAPRNLEFVLGCAAGAVVLAVRRAERWAGVVFVVGLVGFAAAALRVSIAGAADTEFLLLFGPPSTAIVLGATLSERQRPAWRARMPAWSVGLGDASYALYLVHFLAFDVVYHALRVTDALPRVPRPLVVPALLGAALAAGVAVHRFVEVPVTA